MAQENRPNQTEAERERFWSKGDIVLARPVGWRWGAKEGLPRFVHVTISNRTYKQVTQYLGQFQRKIKWSVESSNNVTDIHTMRLTSAQIGPGGKGGYPKAEVEPILTDFGATNFVQSGGELLFDMDIATVIQSSGIWNVDVSGVTFVHENYTDPEHTLTATLTVLNDINAFVANVISLEGDILAIDRSARTVQFRMSRDDVKAQFKRWITRFMNKKYARARYRITGAAVDNAISQGGEVTISAAQLAANLVDNAE